ncbi:hypothetical protein WR25_05142 isoform A [Diploscapter pachys]|uniref:Uncharacterized protein n=1 Tax=Diploscapter pachys TaxID=2018661 RepID=A0A2A2JIL8_9BILA|nr:hypothetical protein WR25_05142 isoform A [Diploscapter pachys]
MSGESEPPSSNAGEGKAGPEMGMEMGEDAIDRARTEQTQPQSPQQKAETPTTPQKQPTGIPVRQPTPPRSTTPSKAPSKVHSPLPRPHPPPIHPTHSTHPVPVKREHVARRARMDAFLMEQSGYRHQSAASGSASSGLGAKSGQSKMNGPLGNVKQQAATPRSSSWSRTQLNEQRLTQSMSARTPRSKSMGRTKTKEDEDLRGQAEAAFREWLKRKASEPRLPKASPSRDQIAKHLREESKQRMINRWQNKKVIRTFQPDDNSTNGTNPNATL